MITYRQLPAEEWERLRPVYEANGDQLPPSESNIVVVAELDGSIIGMFGANSIAHAGPVWVDPEWRNQGIAAELGARLTGALKTIGVPGFLMFPSNPAAEALSRRMGLERLDVTVFKKEFGDK